MEQASKLTVFSLGLLLVFLSLRRERVLVRGLRLLCLDLGQVDLVLTQPGGCDAAGDLVYDGCHGSFHL